MKKLLILVSAILLVGIIYWWKLPNTVQGPSSDHEFEYITRITGNGGTSDTLPMIIALHGHGDTPNNFFDTLLKRFNDQARFIVLKGPFDYPGAGLSGRAWPTDTRGLREYGDALADSVSVLTEDFPTEGKPIVLGFSGGASVAYYLAALHADKFSYIFPLAGRLSSIEIPSLNSTVKVIAFHGTKDQVIGFNKGKTAVQKLKRGGLNAELISFNGGHLDVFRSANDLFLKYLSNAVHEIAP
ncbi:MAG: alpha/beta hydrolase [Candidatus Hodarchaeales archaeon]|jgi:predicted esterase